MALTQVPTGMIADGAVTTVKLADANVTPAKLSQPLTLGTAQATTSGTAIDFTSIPSWVKRITVVFAGVSTNGSSTVRIRLGSGSFVTSGYLGNATTSGPTNLVQGALVTDGFGEDSSALTVTRNSIFTIINISGNTWVCTGVSTRSEATYTTIIGGNLVLGGTLDRLRVTTSNGTDTFDAGSVNILYE